MSPRAQSMQRAHRAPARGAARSCHFLFLLDLIGIPDGGFPLFTGGNGGKRSRSVRSFSPRHGATEPVGPVDDRAPARPHTRFHFVTESTEQAKSAQRARQGRSCHFLFLLDLIGTSDAGIPLFTEGNEGDREVQPAAAPTDASLPSVEKKPYRPLRAAGNVSP